MDRRLFLTFCLGTSLFLEAAEEDAGTVLDIFAPLANGLSQGNAEGFIAALDRSMPDYGLLCDNVRALAAEAEVTSSIELVEYKKPQVELDWTMEIKLQNAGGISERRQQRVFATIGKRKRITSLKPVEFFAPVRT
jgi:hypothetical protein